MRIELIAPIANRISELAFDPKEIKDQIVDTLLEAARWAPSAFNEQPWRFFYAARNNPESFNSILKLLAPGNKEWAQNASLIIITVAKTVLTHNGKMNTYAEHDTGMATANLMIQAEAMGLTSHPMGGFDKVEAAKLLKLDEEYKPIAAIAIGYKGVRTLLSESNQTRINKPRARKTLNEISKRVEIVL